MHQGRSLGVSNAITEPERRQPQINPELPVWAEIGICLLGAFGLLALYLLSEGILYEQRVIASEPVTTFLFSWTVHHVR